MVEGGVLAGEEEARGEGVGKRMGEGRTQKRSRPHIFHPRF